MTIEELQIKGNELADLRTQLMHAEATVTTLKDRIRQIEEEHLPQMMEEAGVEFLGLPDGSRIEVQNFVQARIANQSEAFNWLRETGNDSIIKNQVICAFGRGEEARAQEVLDNLRAQEVQVTQKSTVHPQTLKSFVREALSNPDLQQSLPREAFGVFEGRKVVFK